MRRVQTSTTTAPIGRTASRGRLEQSELFNKEREKCYDEAGVAISTG